jgi:hypothetical protein
MFATVMERQRPILPSLGKIAPWVFTIFGLGRIAPGYVDNLNKHFHYFRSWSTRLQWKRSIQLRQRVYLGAGEGLAKGHRAEDFWHERLLLYVGDGVNTIIDLRFL